MMIFRQWQWERLLKHKFSVVTFLEKHWFSVKSLWLPEISLDFTPQKFSKRLSGNKINFFLSLFDHFISIFKKGCQITKPLLLQLPLSSCTPSTFYPSSKLVTPPLSGVKERLWLLWLISLTNLRLPDFQFGVEKEEMMVVKMCENHERSKNWTCKDSSKEIGC